MIKQPSFYHERIDDIPFLWGICQQLRIAEVLDQCMASHASHQGLSNGLLGVVWLIYILSEGDHRKCVVHDWVHRHRVTLERLLQKSIRDTDFTDDRLSILLNRLSPEMIWSQVEAGLWQSTLLVHEIDLEKVHLDSTTSYGYHTRTEDGLMQLGHSKDHRPDLPQIKLMTAAAMPWGYPIASRVFSGECADDPLYRPLIGKVREIVGKRGLLYTGDAKMAAASTRADIVAGEDYYLVPLPMTGETPSQLRRWVDAVVEGEQCVQLCWQDVDEGEQASLLGAGYSLEREMQVKLEPLPLAPPLARSLAPPLAMPKTMSLASLAGTAGESVKAKDLVQWTETVHVVRSVSYARAQEESLEERLKKAQADLWLLTPAPGRGKKRYSEEEPLQVEVEAVLKQYRVEGLLEVSWQRQETTTMSYVGKGRGGPNRPQQARVEVRYHITQVSRNEAAIEGHKHRLGWRAYVTNQRCLSMDLSLKTAAPGQQSPEEVAKLTAKAAAKLTADAAATLGAKAAATLGAKVAATLTTNLQPHRSNGVLVQDRAKSMTVEQAMRTGRQGVALERDFHILKDRPLGIRPFYVRLDEQIQGLTHLLVLALRVMNFIEMRLSESLSKAGEVLEGLYEGQPKRTTNRPTATRLLKAIARMEMTLTQATIGDSQYWHLTPVSPLLHKVLRHLQLPPELYTQLVQVSPLIANTT